MRSLRSRQRRPIGTANLWWRADRGGAQVSYVGREQADNKQLDHLAVTPQRGSRFDAWFDADSHLLVRTAEPQMFFKAQETCDGYGRFDKAMLAGTRQTDFGTGPSNIQKMQVKSVTHEPALFDIDTGSRSEIDVTGPFVVRHTLRDKYVKGVSAITGWGVGCPRPSAARSATRTTTATSAAAS